MEVISEWVLSADWTCWMHRGHAGSVAQGNLVRSLLSLKRESSTAGMIDSPDDHESRM